MREEEGAAQVTVDQGVPIGRSRRAERRRVERRSIIDDDIDASELNQRRGGERSDGIRIGEIRAECSRRLCSLPIQCGYEQLGRLRRVAVVHDDIETRGVETANDGSADTLRGASDENDPGVSHRGANREGRLRSPAGAH